MVNKTFVVNRKTEETDIQLEIKIDGNGKRDINTSISMFDHLLSQLAFHGLFDIKISATGDDQHHIVEDVGICLGRALKKALGKERNIIRIAHVVVPMDDALAVVTIDISDRGYSVLDVPFKNNDMFGFPADLIRHFLE